MTKKEAMALVNESLIDQDTKFSREIKALFKQQEVVDLLQQSYDNSDDNAKQSLMDATEKQFLDKFAKDGSGDDKEDKKDDEVENDDFLADGSGLDDLDDDGSDNSVDDDSSEDDGSDDDFSMTDNSSDSNTNDSNPFASFGEGESSNPFESQKSKKGKSLNENVNRTRFIRRKK